MRIPTFPSKKTLVIFLALLFVFLLSVTALAADTFTTTVRVNFRRGPSTDTAVIKTLDLGLAVQVDKYDPGGWSKATINGVDGYIKSEYLAAVQSSADDSAGAGQNTREQTEAAKPILYRTTGRVNFRRNPSTSATVIKVLATGTQVEVAKYDAKGWSQVSVGGTSGYIKSEYLVKSSATGTSGKADASGEVYKVELMEWSEAKKVFKTYTPAKITDVRSGAVYYVQSFANGNHADVETLTKADTEIMFATFGRKWSWAVRPVWVTINGHTMAASINGMPHGGGTISSNGMDGQVCIHFKGSLTHNGNKSFERTHQNGVTEAYNAAK